MFDRVAYQRKWIKDRRDVWVHENGPCQQCGSSDRLEVDHIDPTTKSMQVRSIWSRRLDVREAELAKCQVLCFDCHLAKSKLDLRLVNQGAKNPSAKLSEIEAKYILDSNESVAVLADRFGVGKTTVYDIKRRRKWKHL